MPIKRLHMNLPRSAALSILAVVALTGMLTLASLKMGRIKASERHFFEALNHKLGERLAHANIEVDKALHLSPDNAYYLAGKGLILAGIAEKETGGRFLAKFLNDTPPTGQPGSKHLEESIEYYRMARSLSPYDGLLDHNLGWLYWLNNEKLKALSCLKRATESGERDAIYFLSLGMMQGKRGELDREAEAYQTAIMLSPQILASRFYADLRRTDSAKAARILDRAIAQLERETRPLPDPILLARLGRLYLEKGSELAFPMLEKALAGLPNMPMAFFNMGVLNERNGKMDAAIRYYEKAAFLESSDPTVYSGLGRAYDAMGKPDEAAVQYEKAVSNALTQHTEHSRKVLNLYHARIVETNDLIPKDLLSYCMPVVDVPAICKKLWEYYERKQDSRKAGLFRELGSSWALEQQIKFGSIPSVLK